MSSISSTTLEQSGPSGFVEKSSAQQKRMWLRAHNGSWLKSSLTMPLVEPEVDVVSIVVGLSSRVGCR